MHEEAQDNPTLEHAERNFEEVRFEDTRRMWRNLECRERIIRHWLDERHPEREIFFRYRPIVEEVLSSPKTLDALIALLQSVSLSLAEVIAMTPHIDLSFFPADGSLETMENQFSVLKGEVSLDAEHHRDQGLEAEISIMKHHSRFSKKSEAF